MNVLVACEESQEVCKAFRARGHNAFSCDVQPCSGGHPEWHIQEDVLKVINGHMTFITIGGQQHNEMKTRSWDLIIAHPPCTYLTNAGARWLYAGHKLNEERYKKGLEAKRFFMALWKCSCVRVCVENPIPSAVFQLPPYTQIVQPYEFGHPFSKKLVCG